MRGLIYVAIEYREHPAGAGGTVVTGVISGQKAPARSQKSRFIYPLQRNDEGRQAGMRGPVSA